MDLSRTLPGIIFIGAALIAGCSSVAVGPANISQEPISSISDEGVERSIVRITDDIYRFFSNDHSGLFVLTDHGVILIDPLNTPSAEWVKSEINSRFGIPVTHVLYAHGHADHASGAAVFEGATIISHENTFDLITHDESQPLTGRFASYDANGNGVIEASEAEGDFISEFRQMDTNGDGLATGQEASIYDYRDVVPPTRAYGGDFYALETGGKTVEMHFVGGNHAADMSYIFFPKESIVFYVDVISLKAIPHGELTWYSEADSKNTYDKALAIDADIAISSHGPIGTQDDVRALRTYMADLRSAVMAAMDSGQSLEEIQATVLMQDYAHWDYYELRRPLNITGMYRALSEERAD